MRLAQRLVRGISLRPVLPHLTYCGCMLEQVGNGDKRSAAIVSMIAQEEKAHVAVGVVWFGRICAALGQPAPRAYRRWLTLLAPGMLQVSALVLALYESAYLLHSLLLYC